MQIDTLPLTHCVFCHGDQFDRLLAAEDFQAGTGRYSVEICRICNVGLTSPRPTKEALPSLYESQDNGVDISTRSTIGCFLKSAKLKRYVAKLLSRRPKDQLVTYDMGCGDGLLAWMMARSPQCAHVVAFDFPEHPPAVFESRPLPNLTYVPYSALNSIPLPAADLVTLRHVLEHVLDPLDFLKRISAHLRSDGIFVIEIPNRDTVWLKVFSEHYNQLGLPFHLSHFTENSFRDAFSRDFQIHSIRQANVPTLGPSLSLKLGVRTSNIGFFAAALYPVQLAIDKMTGTSTALMIEMSAR